jgi:hypothetical protein
MFWVWDLGFGIWGLGFGVWDFELGGSGCRVRLYGLVLGVEG